MDADRPQPIQAERPPRIFEIGLSCYAVGMGDEKSLFDSPDADADAKSDARAEEDVKAGRLISHDAVRRWLKTWGSAKPLPRPRVGD